MSDRTTTLTPPGSGAPVPDGPPGTGSGHAAGARPVPAGSHVRRWWRGDPSDAAWVRPGLLGLLALTAVLYLWDLGASGWANSFYAAAAQAGSESWKALFFGSSDAASSITVDKTPASLWVMGLSIRLFGLSSWSLLVPQALMGVAAVGVLHATVRRTTRSAGAGLLAGAVLALTPVAVLMFRFDNPDALLVLLLVGSVAATVRALESTELRAAGLAGHPVAWLALAGVLVGLGFLTKMLQAFLVLPALGAVYLLAAHTSLGRRIGHLLVAFGTLVASAGWWVAVVELWPASSRPYIGGSQHNSVLELTLGYNGFGRLTGDETGSVGGAGQGGGRWGSTALLRLLGDEVGGQVAWLLPAAIVLLVAGMWLTRRAPRTDLRRAGLVVWGLWLLVTAATFSFMAGIFHPYYTVALAPAIGALVGTGGVLLWRRRRRSYAAGILLGATVAGTAGIAFVLLERTPGYLPWLKWLVAVVGIASALGLAGLRHLGRSAQVAVASTALVAGLAAPAAVSVTTAATPHTGSIPSAGPATGGFGGRPGPAAGGFGGRPGPASGGFGGRPAMGGVPAAGGPPIGAGGTGGGTGGTGGLLEGSTSSAAMTRLLQGDASVYTWAAATVGSNSASGYQLASGEPVMAIGGFNGTDPSPTLAQFRRYVADGEIHFFIASSGPGSGLGGGFGGRGVSTGGSTASSITSWVERTFTATTVGGVTVYDLSGGVE